MKPYSIERFLELLKQNRIRRTYKGIYFDIMDYPFYEEHTGSAEVLNNLYNIIYNKGGGIIWAEVVNIYQS